MAEGPSDEDLMTAVASGDAGALRVLYARHARWVFARARKRLDAAAAEEIVQEVFLGTYRARERFDASRGTFAAWLAESTRRRVANELRRRSRKDADLGLEADNLPANDAAPDEAAWRAHRSDVLARAVAELPEDQARALKLAFFDDLSHEEIARTLEVPLGTTKTRIRTGLKKLGAKPAVLAVAALAFAAALVWVANDRASRGRAERALAMATASDSDRIRIERAPAAPTGVAAEAHGGYRFRTGVGLAVVTLSSLEPGATYRIHARAGGRVVELGAGVPDAAGKALLVAEDEALATRPDEVWVTRDDATVLAWKAAP